MLLYSTNRHSPYASFETAVFQGLAPDAGLYFPSSYPQLSKQEMRNLMGKPLQEIGYQILNKWLSDEIDTASLAKIAKVALDFPIVIKKVGPYYIMELFHGPTNSFKDVAARVLAQLMNHYLMRRKKKMSLFVATSGDTGGAVAQAFSDIPRVNVFVFFPKGRVSSLQEEQLTRVGKNVLPMEVEGSFDDCHSLVKKVLIDRELQRFNITSANSINIGRLLPQSIYYWYAYSRLKKHNIEFVVPTGNMGNVTAGLLAYKTGMPVSTFVAATNRNNSIVRYLATRKFVPKKSVPTLSNAMDVGNPNNFARVMELFSHNHLELKRLIKASSISDKQTVQTIKKVYKKYHYLLDPHSAVAWAAAEKVTKAKGPTLLLSTASPLKFADEIFKSTGIKFDSDWRKLPFMKRRKRKISIANSYRALKKTVLTQLKVI